MNNCTWGQNPQTKALENMLPRSWLCARTATQLQSKEGANTHLATTSPQQARVETDQPRRFLPFIISMAMLKPGHAGFPSICYTKSTVQAVFAECSWTAGNAAFERYLGPHYGLLQQQVEDASYSHARFPCTLRLHPERRTSGCAISRKPFFRKTRNG